MILGLFGTSPYDFSRLMSALLALAKVTGEEVFVQAGNTPIPPHGLTGAAFLHPDDLVLKIQSASVVVSQGGFGSMRDVLHEGIPLVAVPRLETLGEMKGDQTILVKTLENKRVLVAVLDIADLPAAVAEARSRSTISPPTSTIPTQLTDLVDHWQADS